MASSIRSWIVRNAYLEQLRIPDSISDNQAKDDVGGRSVGDMDGIANCGSYCAIGWNGQTTFLGRWDRRAGGVGAAQQRAGARAQHANVEWGMHIHTRAAI